MEYSNLYMWRHGHNEITAKGKKEVSMSLSDDLWSDCWRTLIFTYGDMDIMKSLPKERKKPLPGEEYQGKMHSGEIHPVQIYSFFGLSDRL